MVSNRFRCVFFYLFIFYSVNLTAQLSKPEKKIIAAVDNRSQSSLSLLKKVVNINSGTMNFDGVHKVGNIFIDCC